MAQFNRYMATVRLYCGAESTNDNRSVSKQVSALGPLSNSIFKDGATDGKAYL